MLLALVPLLLAAADPALDAVLDKLEAHEAKLARIYEDGGFYVTSKVESLDSKGKPTNTVEVETKVTFVGGVRHEEIVKKVENGKDVTAAAIEKRKKKDHDRKKKLESNQMILPFAKKERPKYRFTLKKPDVIAFVPVVEPSLDVYKGEATIDPEKGHVLEVRARPAKYPSFVDKILFTLEFGIETAIGPTPSRLSVDGEGGLLFYRKGVRIRTEFTDYVVPAD